MKMKFSQIMLFLLAVAVLFLVWGCADSSTKGAMKDIDSKVTLTINDNAGTVNIYPGLDVAANAGDIDQDTENSSSVDPKTTANAGWNGGGATGQIDAVDAAAEVAGSFFKDLSNRNSNNPKTEQVTVENDNKTPETTANETDEKIVTVEQHDLRKISNGRCFAWLNHNGDFYGDNIKFVFSDDSSFVVTDGSVSTDQDGGNDRSLMWYFSGNDFKSGDDEFNPSMHESGKGRASVFSKTGSCPSTVNLIW